MKSVAVIVCVVCAAVSLMAAGVVVGVAWSKPGETDLDRKLKQAQLEACQNSTDVFRMALMAQYAEPSDDTRISSTLTNLKTIRSQLQLYKAQHDEQWPTNFAKQMVSFTDREGKCNATQTPQFRFGPYLLRVPANPYTGVNQVTAVAEARVTYSPADDLGSGWWYNAVTGEFRCHLPDSVATHEGKKVNEM